MKYRAFIHILLLAVCMQSCGQLELAPADDDGDGTAAVPPALQGDTLTVAQLAGVGVGEEVLLKAYIVGYVPKGTIKNTRFELPDDDNSNIVVADAPDVQDYARCAPVQLEAGTDARYDLNLYDNPELLGAMVWLYGTRDKYYGAPGIRPLRSYGFPADGTGEDEPDIGRVPYPQVGDAPPAVTEGC